MSQCDQFGINNSAHNPQHAWRSRHPLYLKTIVQESYNEGHQHEFLTLTKLEKGKDFAFFTLTMKEARVTLLNIGIAYSQEKLRVSV